MPKERYEVLGTLGCGATSRVDKARDTVIGRTVAIKTLVQSFGAAADQRQFLREAQIVGQLSHPSIINLYDVGIEDTGIAYLVMEYVAGKTLQQSLSEAQVPWQRACIWGGDLASALGRAHRAGIIHGDVKPANILLTEDGAVKLGDFGIARFATQVSGSGRLMGTPAYLSPEQILGQAQNTRSDLFSLGAVLYQMLTGVAPFQGSSVSAVCAQILSTNPVPPSQRNPAIPPVLDHIVMRCLAKDPADRYPSCEALASSLYPLARGPENPQAKPGRPWLNRPIQPREVWATAAVVVLTLCSVPVCKAIAGRLSVPSAPPAIASLPKPPVESFIFSREDKTPGLEAQVGTPNPEEPALSRKSLPKARISPAASIRLRKSPESPKASNSHDTVPVAPVLAGEATSPSIRVPVNQATLGIQIEASAGEGMLAVFAEHALLVTTELHGNSSNEPQTLTCVLPAGPHQLRVALYRSDKSLQTEKEGLAEIGSNGQNTLRVRVSRRSKMLLKHETALEVVWPGSIAPEHSKSFSASIK